MRFRLRTVRAKLTALVATAVVVMLATLPVLSWLLHRQLIDEVDDRVEDAEKSFGEELHDDLDDLTLAARVIATDTDTMRAIETNDVQRADDLAEVFVGVYPEIDVLITDEKGKLVAQVGCADAVANISEVPEMAPALAGKEARGMTAHGCEKASVHAPPAYMISSPVLDGKKVVGAIVVCMPINAKHLANASRKLGLGLALVDASGAIVDQSEDFPKSSAIGHDATSLGKESTLVDAGDRTFAMVEFAPPELASPSTKLTIAAALDVTDVRRLVRQNLLFALGVLGFAALISVAFGLRQANVMTRALAQVNGALKKLEAQEYVRIETVKTGDELEDLANGFNLMVDGLKERDKLRTTFGKYMTSAVVDHLMSGKVELGGQTLPVTILFSDIRSFTSISEKMDAQELVGLLNEYFTEMVGIIMAEDGVVDKYIGDAVMAVFGAPVPKPNDAIHAVRAAVRMRQALKKLNEKLAERNLGPLRTGIGIHSGPVVAGNIGSELRMEYTVIGDPVNLASRLESSTKDLGVNVLISEDTYEMTKDHIVARRVKEIFVKGREQPVMTYEVLGLVGEEALELDKKEPTHGEVDEKAADA